MFYFVERNYSAPLWFIVLIFGMLIENRLVNWEQVYSIIFNTEHGLGRANSRIVHLEKKVDTTAI